jgi:hypothetical protein
LVPRTGVGWGPATAERGVRPVLLFFGVNISLLFHSVTWWLNILSLAS